MHVTASNRVVVATPPSQHGPVEVLKVSSRSNPNAVAGAMAGVIRQAGTVEVQKPPRILVDDFTF